mmetsp:Transcript_131684/g.380891  ORF Transcript_131684/g.380891 Transcript_131684/m.380891 type:complete len:204 (-) Transcript_131684:113-724(-)|eukprot:CAMPEP_0176064158 /NCGR_PEP_ID=MMETSP0120_2-20121206/31999_1 /TAXON_ID=160619 /ORGANISM="Kryptoperidinium foliaceum, Strain CCMP 1326" /LENGTH=203 /DNA_ID=CAMNT_0017397731 /DNA_START=62 /DNA_END=673 /DNA_ORIENTATION=+
MAVIFFMRLFVLMSLTVAASAARALSPGQIDLSADMTLDDSGAVVYRNGTMWDPFADAIWEEALPNSAFVCIDGAPVGMQMPAVRGEPAQFVYMSLTPKQAFWPLQFYKDRARPLKYFIIVPPLNAALKEWTLLAIGQSKKTKAACHSAFALGDDHPCGPNGDWEAKVHATMAGLASPPQRIERGASKALKLLEDTLNNDTSA